MGMYVRCALTNIDTFYHALVAAGRDAPRGWRVYPQRLVNHLLQVVQLKHGVVCWFLQ